MEQWPKSFAILQGKKLLSTLNILPPSLQDEEETEECLTKILCKNKPIRIVGYLERTIPQFSQIQFKRHFRMTRDTFERLLPVVANLIEKHSVIGRPRIDPERQLLSVLWILSTPDSYRSVAERFDMGKSSLSISFFRIIEALNELAHVVICWPNGQKLLETQRKLFEMAGINGVIGAIDGSFIPIKAPTQDPEVYITRKCNHAITLQAICNGHLKFLNCYVEYPGSVSDTRIFRNSDIYLQVLHNEQEYFPDNQFIIGDKAYPILSWCIPPFVNRGNLTPAQRNFNMKLSHTRQTVERAFALLLGRFRRLKFLDMNRFNFIPATVQAACVLQIYISTVAILILITFRKVYKPFMEMKWKIRNPN